MNQDKKYQRLHLFHLTLHRYTLTFAVTSSLSKRIIYENDSCIIYVHTCIILHNVYIYVSTSLKRLHRRIEAIKGRKKNNSKTSSWFMSYTCALRPTDCLANQLILFSSHSRFPLSKRPPYVEQTYLQRNVPYIGHIVLHMFISIVSPSGKRTIILDTFKSFVITKQSSEKPLLRRQKNSNEESQDHLRCV